MWVKICANTNLADAQLAAELGANAVGFVFAPSKRQVTVEQVAAITAALPDTVEKVGVFPSLPPERIAEQTKAAGLTALQLHSSYDPALVQELNRLLEARLKVIQVVKVPVDSPVESVMDELSAALRDPGLFAVLLDAAQAGSSGGLGVSFPWRELALKMAEVNYAADGVKLFLAGGLNASNVHEAIAILHPDGVDVASGVEAQPGRKSPEKLRSFFEAVRKAS